MSIVKLCLLVCFIYCVSSCRKDGNQNIVAVTGEVVGMSILRHDTTIDATFEGNWDEEQFKIDLDDDGGFDLMFVSYEDTVNFPGGMYQSTRIVILNDLFAIAEQPNTGDQYESIDSTTYDYYGTFPRKTVYFSWQCDSTSSATLIPGINSALFLEKGDFIFKDFQWDNQFGGVQLTDIAVEDAYWNFTMGGDSLSGVWLSFEESCSQAPQKNTFYIAFKKEFGSNIKFGWIELFIENNNKVTVGTSAISEPI